MFYEKSGDFILKTSVLDTSASLIPEFLFKIMYLFSSFKACETLKQEIILFIQFLTPSLISDSSSQVSFRRVVDFKNSRSLA